MLNIHQRSKKYIPFLPAALVKFKNSVLIITNKKLKMLRQGPLKHINSDKVGKYDEDSSNGF